MDANQFDAWTRRRFGRMVGGMATLLLGLGMLDDAKASKGKGGRTRAKNVKDKDKDKDKDNEPVCTSDADCPGECTECADGVCGPSLLHFAKSAKSLTVIPKRKNWFASRDAPRVRCVWDRVCGALHEQLHAGSRQLRLRQLLPPH